MRPRGAQATPAPVRALEQHVNHMVASPRLRRCVLLICLAVLMLAPMAPARASESPGRMPERVPPAAGRSEAAMPVPQGWPFRDAFPRVSGTGRLIEGALEWSDWLYDDHGATGPYS